MVGERHSSIATTEEYVSKVFALYYTYTNIKLIYLINKFIFPPASIVTPDAFGKQYRPAPTLQSADNYNPQNQ